MGNNPLAVLLVRGFLRGSISRNFSQTDGQAVQVLGRNCDETKAQKHRTCHHVRRKGMHELG